MDKDPRAVGRDWPADAPAKMLQNVYWSGESIRLADCIVGAGSGITIVVEPSPVQDIAARACDHVYKACGRATILGTIGRDGNLELLNGILAKNIRHFLTTARIAEIVPTPACPVTPQPLAAVAFHLPVSPPPLSTPNT